MRLLIVITLLLGAAATARPARAQVELDDYEQEMRAYEEQQMRAYDQRVAEAQQRETEQRWKRWLPPAVILAVLIVYLAYSQITNRRRYDTMRLHSQQHMDVAIQQNQEMIDLLKSINDRLAQDT